MGLIRKESLYVEMEWCSAEEWIVCGNEERNVHEQERKGRNSWK